MAIYTDRRVVAEVDLQLRLAVEWKRGSVLVYGEAEQFAGVGFGGRREEIGPGRV
jgi:hypothetical protein